MDPPSLANAAIALLRAYAEDASLAGVDPLRRAVGGCFDPGVAEVDAESAALLHTRVAEDHAFALELERLVVEIEDLGEVEVEIVEGRACVLRKSRTWPGRGDEGAGPHSLAVASEQGPPLGHGALDWFERERANLVVAVARAYEAGAYDTAWRLADGLVGFFDTRSHWDDWVTTHRLAVQAARLVDPRAEAVMLRNLAHVYRYQGLLTEAATCYTQALERFRQVGDRSGEADVIHGIGLIHQDQRRIGDAIEYLEQALTIQRAVEDLPGQAWTLYSLGIISREEHRTGDAVSHFDKSVELFRGLGQDRGEAWALNGFGAASRELRRYDMAIAAHSRSLELFRGLRDRRGEGWALDNLGIALREVGHAQQALQRHQDGLAVFEEIEHLRGQGWVLGSLGADHQALDGYDAAVVFHRRSLAMFRAVQSEKGEGWALVNLGEALTAQGNLPDATTAYSSALRLFQGLSDRFWQARSLTGLGIVNHLQARDDRACSYLERALGVFVRLGAVEADDVRHLQAKWGCGPR